MTPETLHIYEVGLCGEIKDTYIRLTTFALVSFDHSPAKPDTSLSIIMSESPGSMIQLSGFPVGYFVIKNAASRCVFDINGDNVRDGTEAILYAEKDITMVESESQVIQGVKYGH